MAVHLKMDFRVVELTADLSVLQCDRGDADCIFEAEFHPKHSGSLVGAIRQLRLHQCLDHRADLGVVPPSHRILTYPAALAARQAK